MSEKWNVSDPLHFDPGAKCPKDFAQRNMWVDPKKWRALKVLADFHGLKLWQVVDCALAHYLYSVDHDQVTTGLRAMLREDRWDGMRRVGDEVVMESHLDQDQRAKKKGLEKLTQEEEEEG